MSESKPSNPDPTDEIKRRPWLETFRKEWDLAEQVRLFASARPDGWTSEDFIDFLESLEVRGHDLADKEAIGVALEKERLDLTLSKVAGLTDAARLALIERFQNVWGVRNAAPGEVQKVAGLDEPTSERVREAVR